MNEVIHAASNADFTGYTYIQVYASSAATPTINAVIVSMAAGSTLPILVKNISATANVFVLGRQKLIAPSVING